MALTTTPALTPLRHPSRSPRSPTPPSRCVVTDHGAFVLFNVYAPSLGTDEEARPTDTRTRILLRLRLFAPP